MAPRTYRAIFFDLDGTLLPMELDEFLGAYFEAIATFVARHGLDAKSFSAGLKAGIGAIGEGFAPNPAAAREAALSGRAGA